MVLGLDTSTGNQKTDPWGEGNRGGGRERISLAFLFRRLSDFSCVLTAGHGDCFLPKPSASLLPYSSDLNLTFPSFIPASCSLKF